MSEQDRVAESEPRMSPHLKAVVEAGERAVARIEYAYRLGMERAAKIADGHAVEREGMDLCDYAEQARALVIAAAIRAEIAATTSDTQPLIPDR